MKNLTLAVKKEWFEQIKNGTKKIEYRLYNEYWIKRLVGKQFDKIIITLGYPKKDDKQKRLEFKWLGYKVEKVCHKEWDYKYKKVFVIKLGGKIEI